MENRFCARVSRRLAVCVLAGALLGGAAACGQAGHGPSSNGQVISLAGYKGPVVVSADGRIITVGGFAAPCFGTVRPTVRESSHLVRLFLRYAMPRQHGVCNKSVPLILSLHVRLAAPLDGRTIVDGNTARALAYFDGRQMLRPGKIPAGYRLRYLSPVALAGAVLGASDVAACSQYFASPKAMLTIVQSNAKLTLPLADHRRPVGIKVRGHAGEATVNAITWREHGLNVLITAGFIGSSRQVMTISQMIALAESAPASA